MTVGNRSETSQAPESLSDRPPLRNAASDLAAELTRLKDDRDALQRLAEAHAIELEELGRIKEGFIATASHDLKTPLTSMLGYTQYVIRQLAAPAPDLDKVVRGMSIVQAQAIAMSRLLDDLLDASRIQVGAFEVRPVPCDLGTCLDTVLARLSPDVSERVDVTLPDAPVAGQWDRNRLEQVLANLVDNAVKYSPDWERVCIVVDRRSAGIEVAVTDRGMGIPAKELPRLFERYYRTPQAHASGRAGSGLGLFICRGIIAAHGGRLWAESPGEGQGATFRFDLPDQQPSGGFRQPSGPEGTT
jgi:signal transduction histidine kinase